REPFLALAAIAAFPGASRHSARNVVDQPVTDFGELFDRADVGFFIELALGRMPNILAGIDAALRHLPDMRLIDMLDAAGAAPDEDQPVLVDQHDADAGSIGQILVTRHSVNASRGHATKVCQPRLAKRRSPKEPARRGEPLIKLLDLARF